MTKHFIIFGPPGSGKGTQARRLIKRFGFAYLGTGDIVRAEAQRDTTLGHEIKAILEGKEGRLIDDAIINEMVDQKLHKIESSQSILFDGYPRTVSQADHLSDFICESNAEIYVINLDVDAEALLKRIATRRICEKCRKPFQNPEQFGISVCDECGSSLVVRPDDHAEVVKNRLEVYNRNTKTLLDYYQTHGRIINIDGNPPIDEVFDEIEAKVERIIL